MVEDQGMLFCPDASALDGWAEATSTFELMVSELVDNAFDSGAKSVRVVITPLEGLRNTEGGFIEISDDGDGCVDLSVFGRMGDRCQHRRPTSGRYGVGFKDAALWFGGLDSITSVRSVRDGVARSMVFDWRHMREHNWRNRPGASAEPSVAPDGERGTTVVIAPFKRRVLLSALERYASKLGYIYTPALKRGCTLTLEIAGGETFQCQPWKMPPTEEQVDVNIDVDGKSARVVAGITATGERGSRCGLTYYNRHRVILGDTSLGLGSAKSIARICGVVELGPDWLLAKNKDGFGESEHLFEEVEAVLSELIAKAGDIATAFHVSAACARVADLLNADFGIGIVNAKARRGLGESAGSKKPTGTGSKHSQAEVEQDGQTFSSRRRRRMRPVMVDVVPMNTQTVGHCEGGERVLLNSNHPWVTRIVDASREGGDVEAGGMYALARSLYAAYLATVDLGQLQLGEVADSTHVALGQIIAHSLRQDP